VTTLIDRVAGAPITWGVCEVPGWGHQLAADRVLAEMSDIGLRATELGPEGFLPAEPAKLRGLLDGYDLSLVGGFVPIVLHESEVLEAELEKAAASADRLAAGGAEVLVLAASTGKEAYGRPIGLDAKGWRRLAEAIDRVIEIAAERSLSVALHPHHGTVVERREHLDRLLEVSDVSLCLDTGHLLVGGADPVEVTATTADRVMHVHLKDVAGELAEKVRGGQMSYREAVRLGMYRPLGTADVNIAEIVLALERRGYDGWYVLEQDTVLEAEPEARSGPMKEAVKSLGFLKRVGEEVGASAGR
jgi:inosose dehydratase